MSHQQVGLWIIGAGFVVIVVGLIVWAGGLSWFGRLPGDSPHSRPVVNGVHPVIPVDNR